MINPNKVHFEVCNRQTRFAVNLTYFRELVLFQNLSLLQDILFLQFLRYRFRFVFSNRINSSLFFSKKYSNCTVADIGRRLTSLLMTTLVKKHVNENKLSR